MTALRSRQDRVSPIDRWRQSSRATVDRLAARLPIVVVALLALWLLAVVVAVFLPQVFVPGSPLEASPADALQAPSPQHLLGTDQLGRDQFTRIVYGLRYSLGIGVGAMAVSVVFGVLFGLVAGLGGWFVDEVLARFIDIISAFPAVLLALLVIAFTEPGIVNLTIAVGISAIPKFARVIRAETVRVRTSDYVTHAVTFGARRSRLVLRHVLPNTLTLIPVLAMIDVGTAIIAGSGLSFLQLGPQPPTPELGVMLSESRNLFAFAWWLAVFPGVVLSLTVIALTVVGSRLQRTLRRAS